MIDENCPIEDVRALFAGDRFATEMCGCRVIEASCGHAVCAFDIEDTHLNARGSVMGGAIFTLADFALAVACNIGEEPTVAVNNSIQFLNATKGNTLFATCDVDKSGRSLGFYTVDISDDTGAPIAKMTATCFRRSSSDQ
jgi:acyl-CoA thioesterase